MDIKNDEHAKFSRKFSSDMTKVDKGFICSPTIKLNQNSIIAIMRYCFKRIFPQFKPVNWNKKFEFIHLRPLDRKGKKQVDPRRIETILQLNTARRDTIMFKAVN